MKKKLINILSIFFWNIGFHKYEKEHIKKYYNIPVCNLNKVRKGIVVMIDGRQIHGGFADRLRGICTIYQYCKINNINFSIYYSTPFKLEDYLIPNQVQWICKQDELALDSRYARPVFLYEWMFPHKYHKLYLKLRTIFSHKKQLQIYTNSHFYYDSFSAQFQALFKPAPRLLNAININMESINDKYIAMVFRFQQLLGDFKEGTFKTLKTQEQEQLINKCINKTKELWDGKQKILVTSDSKKFLDKISHLEFVYTIPGNVVHIDYTKDANYEAYLKSFIDFYMIANAEKIYLLKTGNMYQSGFPKTASKVYNKPFKVIEF